jgi:gas vesicle protein
MAKTDRLGLFFTGAAIGAAAAVLLAPCSGEELVKRLRCAAAKANGLLEERVQTLSASAEGLIAEGKRKGSQALGDFHEVMNSRIDTAVEATKKAAADATAKSRDLAHSAGKTMEEAGKRLQDV